MNYATFRATIFSRCKRPSYVRRHEKKANRVMAVLTRTAMSMSPQDAVDPRNKPVIIRRAMSELGIPMMFPAFLAPILYELLMLLWPIILKWLIEKLQEIDPADLFSSSKALRDEMDLYVIGAESEL